jgi:hypothetical protein
MQKHLHFTLLGPTLFLQPDQRAMGQAFFAQRRLRQATAVALRQAAEVMPDRREAAEYWTWAKDWWLRVRPGERRWRWRRPLLAK